MTLNEAIQKWTFAKEAYEGSGGFEDGTYLDQYPRESDTKYQTRQETSVYTNLFAPKVNRYIGYIFKKPPTRESANPFIRLMFDDIDNKGNNANVFFSNFAANAKVRGVNLLLVDMPKTLPKTLKEQIESRKIPYFVEVLPEKLYKYKLDEDGKFEWAIFNDTLDLSTMDEQKNVTIYRYYDKNEWRIYDNSFVLLESGAHNLGVCPLLIFSENSEFPSIGEFTSIADLAKKHYNLQSELDEILRSQTFSILTIQASNPSDVEIKLSTENALFFAENMQRPEFIAPPAAPAEIYQNRIKEVENQIANIAFDISTNQMQESGIALDIKFQGLNSSLAKFAHKLGDLEARAFDIACKYLKIKNDITITYPKTFSIIDVNKEIDTLAQMKELIDSPTYFKLKALQIINNDLTMIEVDDFSKIVSEIEDSFKE